MDGAERPTGTVTFLFTDIEGSTRAWQAEPEAMSSAVEAHDDQLRRSIESAGGYVFALGGDSFAAAFQTVGAAVAAATAAQQSLRAHEWPTAEPLRVRMGIHTGSADQRSGNYFGPTVNRAARLMSAGHGGQILLSETSASLLESSDRLRNLGERRLADVDGFEVVHQLGDERFPPLRAVAVFSCDIPVARTVLFGRDEELSDIDSSLQSSRLVTLMGVGGIGKTRLAFEAARAAQARFEAGARLVDLTAVADQREVASAVAAAVDAMPGDDAVAAAASAIGGRDVLLVFDNCEHVIDAVADCTDELLSACPHLRVIATSRETLEVEGELVYPVPPLDPGGAAMDLFCARVAATGVDPGLFDASDIADLCARLDGLPLAVELAAARARTLTPVEVIARLDAGADLGIGRSRRRRRHDTLEATIAWSYDLLDDDEKLVLRRCALFEADFPCAGIETTSGLSSGRTIEVLDGLVGKSLVVRVAGVRDGASRYRLLETIRDFAAHRLQLDDDLEVAHDRLVDYTVELFDEWLAGSSRRQLVDELVAQRATVATAARYADTAGRIDALGDIVQLAMLAWLVEPTTGSPDDLVRPERLAELPDDVRGAVIVQRAIRLLNAGDADGCMQAVDRALQLSAGRDRHYASTALSVQARLLAYVAPEAALEISERAFTMRNRAESAPRDLFGGDATWMWRMHDHASNLVAVGNMDAAWETLLEAVSLGPDVNPLAHHMLFTDVLWTAILVERPEAGLDLATAALGPDLKPSRRWPSTPTPLPLAHAATVAAAGDPDRAERMLLATIESWTETAAPMWSTCVVAFGVVAFHAGDVDRATRLLEPVPKAAMSVLMTRRAYRTQLGIPPSSSAPLESATDVDVDIAEIKAIVDTEVRRARHDLAER